MKVPPVRVYFPDEDQAEILQKIKEVLSSGQLTMGKYGKELEKSFARHVGTKYAVAVSSGTAAIEICLRILSVEGKEVLVPTNTFFATPAAVLHAGAKIRFVDADPDTFSIDAESLERTITEETVGVIVVHIGGIVTPQMDRIQQICEMNDLFLIEDAAHAHGSSVDGRMAGSFGKAASFSFYPTKVMTSGEGGIIVTNSQRIKEEALMYRDQGKASFTANIHDKLGYNWRMSEFHAIIGLSQSGRIGEFIENRTKIARIYDEGLKSIPGVTSLVLSPECRTNYYKYIALLDKDVDRAKLKSILRKEYEVRLSGEVYELPCHLQPIFRRNCKQKEFPQAEDICQRHICLPIFATMTPDQADHVLSSLEAVLRKL